MSRFCRFGKKRWQDQVAIRKYLSAKKDAIIANLQVAADQLQLNFEISIGEKPWCLSTVWQRRDGQSLRLADIRNIEANLQRIKADNNLFVYLVFNEKICQQAVFQLRIDDFTSFTLLADDDEEDYYFPLY